MKNAATESRIPAYVVNSLGIILKPDLFLESIV